MINLVVNLALVLFVVLVAGWMVFANLLSREGFYGLVPLSVYRKLTPEVVAHWEAFFEEEERINRRRREKEAHELWLKTPLVEEEYTDVVVVDETLFPPEDLESRRRAELVVSRYLHDRNWEVDERVRLLDDGFSRILKGLDPDEKETSDLAEEEMRKIRDQLVAAYAMPETHYVVHDHPDRAFKLISDGELVVEVERDEASEFHVAPLLPVRPAPDPLVRVA